MISLPKNNLATILRDYAHIRYEMVMNPNFNLTNSIVRWINIDNTKSLSEKQQCMNYEYLMSVYRIYLMYTTLKYFSIIEENSINFISEEELEFDISKITTDKNISKKKQNTLKAFLSCKRNSEEMYITPGINDTNSLPL